MSQGIVFQHNTLKLPCRFEELQMNARIDGYKIINIISVDCQKSVFLLEPSAVLCVRHSNRKLPDDLCNALKSDTIGLVKTLKCGVIKNHWYTIDQKLTPIPKWSTLDDGKRKDYVKQMVVAINNLHNLGYCHLDIKLEHFGLDSRRNIRLLDFDSALPYTATIVENRNIEYTPAFAAPEIFEGRYSTASDFYSLGKVLIQWGNINPNTLYQNWKKIFKHLINSEYSSRYNYTQIMQALDDNDVECFTGPRSYKEGIKVGLRKAYSDRQLALFLSQRYTVAESYVCQSNIIYTGNSIPEKIARLIHRLDPKLPLWWQGNEFSSTQDIAREMSCRYPQKNLSMCELLRSGILLEFNTITSADESLVQLLQNAKQNPERCYWEVSRAFGGRFYGEGSSANRISLTGLSGKISELNSLLSSRIQHGNPITVASALESIQSYPNSQNIDSVIARIRAIPINTADVNLTNIDLNYAFGRYIETRLPEPGYYSNATSIDELFTRGTLYIISKDGFEQWKTSNQNQNELRHERNVSIWKAIGWTALGAAFLAVLPYILAALVIIGIIVLIFSVL